MGRRIRAIRREEKNSGGNSKSANQRSCLSKKCIDSTVLQLQKKYGNSAMQRMHESGVLQAKLKIGKPGDKYEREADSIADHVMNMPEPNISRQEGQEEEVQPKPIADQITPLVQKQEDEEEVQKQPEEEEEPTQAKMIQPQTEEEEEPVQAQAESGRKTGMNKAVESSIHSARGGGQPLSKSSRNFFENRFSMDFSGVRVHNDSNALQLASSINAKAFTIGHDIFFGSGEYSPQSNDGKKLIAHELTHTIQQNVHQRPLKYSTTKIGDS